MLAKIIDAMSQTACEHPDIDPESGFASPNQFYINIAKYKYANDQHECSKLLADIGGGLSQDTFCYRDWTNPVVKHLLAKYLAGIDTIPTEQRLLMMRMIKDMTGGNWDGITIHTEGALVAQEMALFAAADWERLKAIAKRTAGIPGWEKHPGIGNLPPHHHG